MKSTDHVYALIQQMSQAEKRYFKRFSTFQNPEGTCDYVRLFDILEKQKNYDEPKAIKALGKSFFAQQKRHLYLKVLESLRLFHSGKHPENQIHQLVDEVRLLAARAFLSQALKLLEKGIQIAAHQELSAYEITLLQLKTDLLNQMQDSAELKTHLPYCEKRMKTLNKEIFNETKVEQQYYKLLYLNARTEFLRLESEISDLEKSMDLPEDHTMNTRSRVKSLYLSGISAYLRGNFDVACRHFQEALSIHQQKIHLFQEDPHQYAKLQSNYILCSLHHSPSSDIVEEIQGLKKHIQIHQLNAYLERVDLFRLMYFNRKKEWTSATQLLHKKEKYLHQLFHPDSTQETHPIEQLWWLFSALETNIYHKEYKESLQICELWLGNKANQNKSDIHLLTRFIYLFLLLLTGEEDKAGTEIRQLKKRMLPSKNEANFDQQTLQFCQFLLDGPSKEKLKTSLQGYLNELEKIKSSYPENNILHYFPIPLLLQRVAENNDIKWKEIN